MFLKHSQKEKSLWCWLSVKTVSIISIFLLGQSFKNVWIECAYLHPQTKGDQRPDFEAYFEA